MLPNAFWPISWGGFVLDWGLQSCPLDLPNCIAEA